MTLRSFRPVLVPLALFLLVVLAACTSVAPTPAPKPAPGAPDALAFAPGIAARLAKVPPTAIDFDKRPLDDKEQEVLRLLVDASRVLEEIYWQQAWEGNPALRQKLVAAADAGKAGAADALAFFDVNKGPWDRIDGDKPFIGSRPNPPGAGFYPEDVTKGEIDSWLGKHPGDRTAFEKETTVIRRRDGGLVAVPYSVAYGELLHLASARLKEAAGWAENRSLKSFLEKRADALLTDDYFESEVAWMDLDSDLEVVFGPYETYGDGLYGRKAAFEAFLGVRDRVEGEKLAGWASHLVELEKNLPIPDEHKNFRRGASSPIVVVQEAFTAGDARTAVQTAAFNLPNDERVREAKGSKKVMLKNVMEAKYRIAGHPIAERVVDADQLSLVSFPAFFDHVLCHELSHALGPGIITTPDGRKLEWKNLVEELHSTIEECKADVVGLWSLLWGIRQGMVKDYDEAGLYVTNAGLLFRSMRFGLGDAHGAGTAIQWNWHREHGGIVPSAGGRFLVDVPKFRESVRSLAEELLMIEATGDRARAKKLVDGYGKTTPEIDSVNARLGDIPIDIRPVFTGVGEAMPKGSDAR